MIIPHSVIGFAGSGHGGIAALKSLQQIFPEIEVITSDKDILSLLRPTDKKIDAVEKSTAMLVVCAAYANIISKELLQQKTFINTHPSLLPKYRGVHSLVWGMLNFEKELGFTVHLMNEYIDDGDILEQFKVKYNNQTSQEVMAAFDNYVEKELGRVVYEYVTGKLHPIKQNKEDATWVARRNIDDCLLDFNRSNKYIDRFFKALVRPYPLPMLEIKKRIYEIDGYRLLERKYETHNGRVVNIEDFDVYIKIAEGLLVIDKLVDFESKERIKAASILKAGQRLFKS